MVFQPPRPLLLVHFILLNTSAPFSKEIFFSFSGIHFEVFIFHSNFRFLDFSIDSLSLLPREKKNLKKWLDCFNVAYCGLFGGRQGWPRHYPLESRGRERKRWRSRPSLVAPTVRGRSRRPDDISQTRASALSLSSFSLGKTRGVIYYTCTVVVCSKRVTTPSRARRRVYTLYRDLYCTHTRFSIWTGRNDVVCPSLSPHHQCHSGWLYSRHIQQGPQF